MGVFKNFIYSILTSCNKKCLPLDQCPAVQAELEDEPGDEVSRICEQCWNKLHQNQK